MTTAIARQAAPIDIPPHDPDAENALIGAILIGQSSIADGVLSQADFDAALATLPTSRAGLFIDGDLAAIYSACRELVDAGGKVDAVTLRNALAGAGLLDRVGGVDRLIALSQSVPSAANIGHYAGIVLRHANQRRRLTLTDQLRAAIDHGEPTGAILDELKDLERGIGQGQDVSPRFLLTADLLRDYPELRGELIQNILRRSEVGNVIAAPKTRKSWLILVLAVAFCMGWRWLDLFQCAGGRVLLIDLELHRETLAKRLRDVLNALGLSAADLGDRLAVECLRGRQVDVNWLAEYAGRIGPGQFDLVLIDPLFKLLPRDADENANVQMSNLYSTLMATAESLQAGLLLVHHLAKGDNAGKAITDLGAGAGAQSRACDAHLTLREHSEPECVVFDGVVRSWAPITPTVLRWQYPLWTPAPELDATDLKRPPRRNTRKAEAEPTEPARPVVEPWTAERFAGAFVASGPQMRGAIIARARAAGLSQKMADSLLSQAEGVGLAFRWNMPKDRRSYFANRPQESPIGVVE